VNSRPGRAGGGKLGRTSCCRSCWDRPTGPAGPAEAHAFVDRPACTIDRTRELYVTSPPNIVDSITALTEKAVGPYPWPAPYVLPQEVFERLVSKPFEADVIRLFRQHGVDDAQLDSLVARRRNTATAA
jgi:hypothetical protein